MIEDNPSNGNREQVRHIAKQLFEEWHSEKKQTQKWWEGSAPAWFAVILSLGTLVWQAAVTSAEIKNNSRRISLIESAGVGDRLARIETKVDLLLEERDFKQQQGVE